MAKAIRVVRPCSYFCARMRFPRLPPPLFTDQWANGGYSCALVESQGGCDCTGCTCPLDSLDSLDCPATCFGYNCDYWKTNNPEYTCEVLASQHECDCSGCSTCADNDSTPAPSPEKGTCYTVEMTDTFGDGWGGPKWYWASKQTPQRSPPDPATVKTAPFRTAPVSNRCFRRLMKK